MATLSPSSFHPTLSVPLSQSFLGAPDSCQAYVLVSLPPALFVDPWQPPVSTASSHNGDDRDSLHIAAAHFLAAGDKSNVELEKAVGWTHDKQKIRRRNRSSQQAGSSSGGVKLNRNSAGSDADQLGYETVEQKKFVAGKGIVTETIHVVSPDYDESGDEGDGRNVYAGSSKSNKERESVLFQIDTTSPKSEVKSELALQQNDGTATTTVTKPLSIPLHARYLPPKDNQEDHELGIKALFRDISQSLLNTTETVGNYFDISIEGLETFWACTSEQSHLFEQKIPRKCAPTSHLHIIF